MVTYKRLQGRRPKYGKSSYKKRTSRLQRQYVASPRTGSVLATNKFYPGLQQNLYQSVDAVADTRFQFDTYDILGAMCRWTTFDIVDLSKPINTSGPTGSGRNWYYNQLINNLNTYQEARLKMSKFSIDISLDTQTTIGASTAISPCDRIDIALAVVPNGYIRDVGGVLHGLADIGTWNMGVDYYSALTHMKGAKFFSLTTDGTKSNTKATFYIDGLSHNGVSPAIKSTATWTPVAHQPDSTITWPTSTERQIILMAVRYKAHSNNSIINEMNLRYSLRVQNSYHFTDIVPQWPYATGTGII